MCWGDTGDAPEECTADLATQIVSNHLATTSMLTIIPMQDWFAMDDSVKRKDYEAERINVPSDYKPLLALQDAHHVGETDRGR